MRCIIAVDFGGRYRYYVTDTIYSDDARDARIFPNSHEANAVSLRVHGVIIPI